MLGGQQLFGWEQQQKMDAIKTIGSSYHVVHALFQVHSYLYAQVCSVKNNAEVVTAALYIYQNEDPSQCLKMLREKLDIKQQGQPSCLIFPYSHIKESFNDKNISLFFIHDYILPLRNCRIKHFATTEFLQILHGGLSSLNQLHMRDIIHGNITPNTCYLVRQKKKEPHCRFAFNILDTNYFTEDNFEGIEDKLFQSEGQTLGQTASFKDDLESLVYLMTHLVSRGKLFTVQRFQLEWITQAEFLRWKSCQFFKEMIHRIPPELEILIEIYTIAKTLRRNEKPDYLKLIKKVLNIMAAFQMKSRQSTSELHLSIAGSISNIREKPGKNKSSEPIGEEDVNVKVGQLNVNRRDSKDGPKVKFNV